MKTLEEVANYALTVLEEHPERDMNKARKKALLGEPREYPVLTLNHINNPSDTFVPQDEIEFLKCEITNSDEENLAFELLGKLEPLKLLNPVALDYNMGKGPGTLVTCFGIPLDPYAHNSPTCTISIEEFLAMPFPNLPQSGMIPEILAKIDIIKNSTPDALKIGIPDTQGPFNLAHTIIGEEILMEAYLNPGRFHQVMDKITDFWIQAILLFKEAVGPERETVWDSVIRLRECSVNLISPDMYKEFVLPYDMRGFEVFGKIGIHPCSGTHVFHATLENIPRIEYTEAGHCEGLVAETIKVDQAIKALHGSDILLIIGQELPIGSEMEFIKSDLNLYRQTNKLLFYYTGTHWSKKDRKRIREMHLALDNYWKETLAT